MVASWQQHEHGSRRISIVGSRYLITTSEDVEDFMCSVIWREWISQTVTVIVMNWINPVIDLNPTSSHKHMTIYYMFQQLLMGIPRDFAVFTSVWARSPKPLSTLVTVSVYKVWLFEVWHSNDSHCSDWPLAGLSRFDYLKCDTVTAVSLVIDHLAKLPMFDYLMCDTATTVIVVTDHFAGLSVFDYFRCYNEWINQSIRGGPQLSGPCTATFNDLLCFPFYLLLYWSTPRMK
jgi:hypothetical protein